MAAEITQAHLLALRQSASVEAEHLKCQVAEYQTCVHLMQQNPTPPELAWSNAANDTARIALRTRFAAAATAITAIALTMQTSANSAVADWT